MRRERPRRRAAVQRLQHRRLDLEIPSPSRNARIDVIIRERATKQRPHLGMHREIGVALAISLLRIGESGMPHHLPVDDFFLAERKRPKRLREQLDRRRREPSPRRCESETAGRSTPMMSPRSKARDARTPPRPADPSEVELDAPARGRRDARRSSCPERATRRSTRDPDRLGPSSASPHAESAAPRPSCAARRTRTRTARSRCASSASSLSRRASDDEVQRLRVIATARRRSTPTASR